MNKYSILYFVTILFLVSSCRKSDLRDIENEEEGVTVNFKIDTRSIDVDSDIDLVPMSRGELKDDYNDFCYAMASHIIMKQIPGSENYVVVSVSTIPCVKNTGGLVHSPENIQLRQCRFTLNSEVLSPGHYKSLVVLNASVGIREGEIVTRTTNILSEVWFKRPRSIYIGLEEFNVDKEHYLQDNTGETQSITYNNIHRYTTPINIILLTSDVVSSYSISGKVICKYPAYIDYEGALVYDSSITTSESVFKTSYNILTSQGWCFSQYLETLSSDYTSIYPLVYTKDYVQEPLIVSLRIEQIEKIYEPVLVTPLVIDNLQVKDGYPFNVIIDLRGKTGIPDVITDQQTVNDLWKKTQTTANEPFIPLNYVEYNKDNY